MVSQIWWCDKEKGESLNNQWVKHGTALTRNIFESAKKWRISQQLTFQQWNSRLPKIAHFIQVESIFKALGKSWLLTSKIPNIKIILLKLIDKGKLE